jgi:prephenate dehydrogenase
MHKPHITIVGLGLIGGSIGMALRAGSKAVHVTGHDVEPGLNKLAQKKGAVDESSLSLPDACTNADLVVIATPITAMREALATIAPHLKPGCVVTDTAPLKEPVLAWAKEILPDRVPFVGGAPVINPAAQPTTLMDPLGLASARADLFQDALYALCAPPQVDPKAVKRVTDMVTLIRARPFYVDPVEHDGIQAVVRGLPALVNLALVQQVGQSPGWREARKLADHVFGMATAPLAKDAAPQRAQALLNAAHLLPRLEALVNELTRLGQLIEERDASALEQAFEQAVSVRQRWLVDRARAEWDEEISELALPGALGALGNLFGVDLTRPQEEE